MTKTSPVNVAPVAPRVRVVWPIVCAITIFVLSIVPSPAWPGARREFFTSLAMNSRSDWLDITANIILYLPLGLAMAAAGIRRSRALLLGVTLSTTAELLQFVIPGRDPSLRDILTNTVGTALGAYATLPKGGRRLVGAVATFELWLVQLLDPTEARANLLCLCHALFVAALTAATTTLLVPWAPAVRQYVVANAMIDPLPGAVIIGAGGDTPFTGLLDDVRIYTQARSEDEIDKDSQTGVTAEAHSDPSLVAAFGFDDDPPRVAIDVSGHGHDGVLEGVSIVSAGRHGKAAAFNGASRMIIPGAPSFAIHDAVTLETWVYLDQDTADAPVIAQEGGAYAIGLSAATGRRRLVVRGRYGGLPTTTRSVEPVPLRQWTHIATTYDGEHIRVFVNGRLVVNRRRWSPHRPTQIVLDGKSLPFGVVAADRHIASALLRPFTLNVNVACGRLDAAAAPLFLVSSARSLDPLALVAQGSDVLVRNWTIGRAIGLLAPEYRFHDALVECSPGRRVDLKLSGTLKRPQLTVDDHTVPGASLGIGSAWAFIIHSELLPGWLRDGCTMCWLAALLLPFGYWLRRGVPGALASALVVFGVIAVPRLFGFAQLTAGQLIAVAGGVLIGIIASRSRRVRRALPAPTPHRETLPENVAPQLPDGQRAAGPRLGQAVRDHSRPQVS